jgi:hypothetical protein
MVFKYILCVHFLVMVFKYILGVLYFLSVQIKVSNSALVSAFMKELEPESPVSQVVILVFCKCFCRKFAVFGAS